MEVGDRIQDQLLDLGWSWEMKGHGRLLVEGAVLSGSKLVGLGVELGDRRCMAVDQVGVTLFMLRLANPTFPTYTKNFIILPTATNHSQLRLIGSDEPARGREFDPPRRHKCAVLAQWQIALAS